MMPTAWIVAALSLAGRDSEVVIGPNYTVDPDVTDHGRPKGRRFELRLPLAAGSIFNGTGPCVTVPGPSQYRQIFVQIPAAYVDGDAAPLLIVQDDGQSDSATSNLTSDLLNKIIYAQANLATANASRSLPAFITVAVANGGGGSERLYEYCSMSDDYARFVEHEVPLPERAAQRRPHRPVSPST
jgi:hypothetical protein